eukprot:3171657-Pleurochrysis_carterae.AAC.1
MPCQRWRASKDLTDRIEWRSNWAEDFRNCAKDTTSPSSSVRCHWRLGRDHAIFTKSACVPSRTTAHGLCIKCLTTQTRWHDCAGGEGEGGGRGRRLLPTSAPVVNRTEQSTSRTRRTR